MNLGEILGRQKGELYKVANENLRKLKEERRLRLEEFRRKKQGKIPKEWGSDKVISIMEEK